MIGLQNVVLVLGSYAPDVPIWRALTGSCDKLVNYSVFMIASLATNDFV